MFYQHAIADSMVATDVEFHAAFDAQDTLDFQISTGARPPQDWTSREERTFFIVFVSLLSVPYDVYFTADPNRPDQLGPTEAIFYRRYRVWAGDQPLAVGLADITLRRVGANGDWKIVYWLDHRDTTAADVWSYGRRRLDSLSH